MPDYAWPNPQQRPLIGKRISRIDGPVKAAGRAKYTYDYNEPGTLSGIMVRCPHAHAKVTSVDISAAQKMPGVKAIKIIQGQGKEIHWAGDEIVGIAAIDEATAEDAARAVKVQYEPLPHLVSDAEPPKNIAVNEGPLTQDDLESMLDNQVPNSEIAAYIKKNGVAFTPTPQFLEEAPKYGVPERVIEALRTAQVKQPAAPKTPSWYRKAAAQTAGDPDAAFKDPEAVISEGLYGIPVITHCCLEAHGAVSEFKTASELNVRISTQNVSGIAGEMSQAMDVPAGNIHVHMDHIGGGFGSKFSPDRWTIVAAELSKMAGGKPVKMMLPRNAELEVAGARPSAYARVKVAAKKDGTLTGWQHDGWGTGGPGGGGQPPIPYVFGEIPNRRTQYTAIVNNIGPSRAWRAPNHPQAALITMAALEDLADKLQMDPIEFFTKNLELTGPRARFYRDELPIAAELSGWKQNWRPRVQNASSRDTIKRGLGISIHTWGGRGHDSNCDLTIHPDGTVEIRMCSQDLGTGTRTVISAVAADTLGVPLSQIALHIGDNRYPASGGSGGSTTVGGVSSSVRRASVDARDAVLAKLAPALGTAADQLDIVDGTVRTKGGQSLTWKEACAKLGPGGVVAHGKNPDRGRPPDLTNSGVGGVQVADVSVDIETGIVRVNKMVAVQDCGLIIDMKTAESQVYGALIMGTSYALYEEKVMDQTTGRMLNPNMEFYRLAGIGDIPELVVHMMTGKGYDERGVIGLGEPPVISPGAAISNAVANAIGVRVPFLPLTPDRVLAALHAAQQKGAGA